MVQLMVPEGMQKSFPDELKRKHFPLSTFIFEELKMHMLHHLDMLFIYIFEEQLPSYPASGAPGHFGWEELCKL